MGTEWTKLADTELWAKAEARITMDTWRTYHGFGHPLFMYEQAKNLFGFDYCRDLDVAILTHDVIASGPHPEVASWDWLRAASEEIGEAYDSPIVKRLIESTIDHRPGADNRLILLDLSGFMSDIRKKHTYMLRREAENRNGTSSKDFNAGTEAYLTGLIERIEEGMEAPEVPDADVPYFERICAGIKATIGELDVPAMVTNCFGSY